MDYPIENLGPERFQRVCQALLAKEFPSARLLPVGQPDGGRDAFVFQGGGASDRKRELTVFQVKFARDPASLGDPRKWVIDAIEKERPKIAELAKHGASRYRLITNVKGSAHLGTGSVDKLDTALEGLAIPADGWWRDDLLARLDNAWDIKWAFPELLTGPDLLRGVIQSGLTEDRDRRESAIRAYLADQHDEDTRVKFKQVELENRLLELFVDVPVTARPHRSRKRRTSQTAHSAHLRGTEIQSAADPNWSDWEQDYLWPDTDRTAGAASFLLHADTCDYAPWVVLEGAPGQGKSTVSQYVCQVHRMRLLGIHEEISDVPELLVNGPLRLPFRVDLRDLSSWLHNRNPFGEDGVGLSSRRSLETFLAAQVEHTSGGAEFSVADLHAVGRVSSLLIVLDGLDEVADIEERRKVVAEISAAVGRLRQVASSLQVLVTSRPAAFENSPGFSGDKFFFAELGALTPEAISDYAERWIRARGLPDRVAAAVRRVLKEKLSQPHMRELARNPMQLAILLSLIHRRGPSLPDKRTALYDSYVNTFFDREAEKNESVQIHRDLLIELHQFLAWVLQTEAEKGNSQGSVEEARLRELLREYLERQQKDVALVDLLFQSLVERVVAIVSRVQGTYEFEVQPLREYFAARYLYDTAPYSPTGAEVAGEKVDRFDALARNFYWLNVTRFFAGCASKGELPSLVDRLQVLAAEEGFRYTDQPRVLATMLLADWVFTQHPRSMRAVVDLLLDNLASRGSHELGSSVLALPEGSGRSELCERSWQLCGRPLKRDRLLSLAQTLKANADTDQLNERWLEAVSGSNGKARDRWLNVGLWTGAMAATTEPQLHSLLADRSVTTERLGLIASAGKGAMLDSPELSGAALDAVLNGDLVFRVDDRKASSAAEAIGRAIDYVPDATHMHRRVWKWWREEYSRPTTHASSTVSRAWDVADALRDELIDDPTAWLTSLKPWDRCVEAIRQVWGDRWCAMEMAVVAAGVRAADEQGSVGFGLLETTASLCDRSRYARLRAGAGDWWCSQLEIVERRIDRMWIVAMFFAWASPKTMQSQIHGFNDAVEGMTKPEAAKVRSAVFRAALMQRDYSARAAKLDPATLPRSLNPSVALMLSSRFDRTGSEDFIARYVLGYTGTDTLLLGRLAHYQLTRAYADSARWPDALAAVRRAYAAGVVVPGTRRVLPTRPRVTMPIELAKDVIGSSSDYPISIVALAESTCRASLGEHVSPLADVAQRDHWQWV
jgi:hypothetical protein